MCILVLSTWSSVLITVSRQPKLEDEAVLAMLHEETSQDASTWGYLGCVDVGILVSRSRCRYVYYDLQIDNI
ncbi:hypothetical protein C2E23DRAFT_275136 [Lenzites betulinus]|nr:hypothetical protein C2E23DRAFT_275136 [Lenzites betulinus]